jgi:diguanylate cyclase (GGDEF)-like protein
MKEEKEKHKQPFSSTWTRSALPRVLQSICVGAAAVDVLYFVFFLWFDSPWLAWINLISVSMYAAAYSLLRNRRVRPAVFLIWLEAFPHAIYGVLMLGWTSGFHFLLLMFVPGVVMSSKRRQGALFIGAMVVFLLALYELSLLIAPITPIEPKALEFLGIAHFVTFVVMFSWSIDYYRGQLSNAERQLQALATTDPLTKLLNRRHFTVLAERSLSQAARAGLNSCIAMIDIDFFKRINDAHGHDAGDLALVTVGELMAKQIRSYNLLSRWGGEEFLVLMPDTDIGNAQEMLERIRRQVQDCVIKLPSKEINLTISIGATQIEPGEKFDAALTRADKALYKSKSQGRNRISVE